MFLKSDWPWSAVSWTVLASVCAACAFGVRATAFRVLLTELFSSWRLPAALAANCAGPPVSDNDKFLFASLATVLLRHDEIVLNYCSVSAASICKAASAPCPCSLSVVPALKNVFWCIVGMKSFELWKTRLPSFESLFEQAYIVFMNASLLTKSPCPSFTIFLSCD